MPIGQPLSNGRGAAVGASARAPTSARGRARLASRHRATRLVTGAGSRGLAGDAARVREVLPGVASAQAPRGKKHEGRAVSRSHGPWSHAEPAGGPTAAASSPPPPRRRAVRISVSTPKLVGDSVTTFKLKRYSWNRASRAALAASRRRRRSDVRRAAGRARLCPLDPGVWERTRSPTEARVKRAMYRRTGALLAALVLPPLRAVDARADLLLPGGRRGAARHRPAPAVWSPAPATCSSPTLHVRRKKTTHGAPIDHHRVEFR